MVCLSATSHYPRAFDAPAHVPHPPARTAPSLYAYAPHIRQVGAFSYAYAQHIRQDGAFARRHGKLNEAVCELIDDFGLVSRQVT